MTVVNNGGKLNYKGAFECHKCPGNADPALGRACPMWWETVHTNVQTGDVQSIRSCGYTQLPVYLVEVIKAANRPAAAIESTRNEIANGFGAIVAGIAQQNELIPKLQAQLNEQKSELIEDQTDTKMIRITNRKGRANAV